MTDTINLDSDDVFALLSLARCINMADYEPTGDSPEILAALSRVYRIKAELAKVPVGNPLAVTINGKHS